MQFSIRQTNYQNNAMLNMCDAQLIGKSIRDGELEIKINKNYYGERLIEKNEAEELLKTSSIINMVGQDTISLSISLGIGSKEGVKTIDNIPFLIVFKM